MKDFQKKILHSIRSFPDQPLTPQAFNELALETYRYQRSKNPIYRSFCDMRGVREVLRWQDIPFLPASIFKTADAACFDTKKAVRMFQTSGTTQGERRGRHFYPSMDFYDAAIRSLVKHFILPDCDRISMVHLIADESGAPDSSLSYMTARMQDFFGDQKTALNPADEKAAFGGVVDFLKKQIRLQKPVLILSTSFALAAFLEHLGEASVILALPEGSRIMETGGFKGRRKEVVRDRILKDSKRYLGIESHRVINEYGMTELTSQLYDAAPPAGVKRALPWMRLVVTDPETDEEVEPNASGLLRIIDLANQYSCAFIQTEDEAARKKNGVEILGRLKGSELRGCSLSFEERGASS